MNKWYINLSGKKKGPLFAKELYEMFLGGEVKKFTLCWCKGMDHWQPFFEVQASLEDELMESSNDEPPEVSLPPLPELPSIPVDDDREIELNEEESKSDFVQVTQPEEVVETFSDEVDELDEGEITETDETSEDEFDEVYEFAQDSQEPEHITSHPDASDDLIEHEESGTLSIVRTAISGLAVFLFIIGSLYVFTDNSKSKAIFKNVSASVLRNLTADIKESKFFMQFGLDKKGQVIYGNSNLAKAADYEAEFRYLGDGVLSDKVVFTSSAFSKGGAVKFDLLTFKEGEKIRAGKYEVKVRAKIDDPIVRLKNLVLGKNSDYTFKNSQYLVPKDKKTYLEELKKLKVNLTSKEREVLLTLEQRAVTIDSILTTLGLQFRIALKEKYGKKGSKKFESLYANTAGPLLQSLIIEDFNNLILKSKRPTKIQKMTDQLHGVSKEVAAWSAELSQSIAKEKRLNSVVSGDLLNDMNERLKSLKNKVSAIREEIEIENNKL